MTGSIRHIGLLTFALVSISAEFNPVLACKYNVRDAGFVDWSPSPYKLYGFVTPDSPTEFSATLRNTAAALFLDSNVELELVNIRTEPNHPALRFTRDRPPTHFPALVLVSPKQESLSLPLRPLPNQIRENIWNALEPVVSSSLRDALFKRIIEAYAVVLLLEGRDARQNQAARTAANDAISRVASLMKDLPKAVNAPPEIKVIPPFIAAKEKVLLWSLGLDPSTNQAQATVLYGRGRQIGPVLAGQSVTADALYQILAVLGQDCECSLDRAWMSGPLIPTLWGPELQARVQNQLGFDAENPMVKTEISRIMSRGPSASARPVGLPDSANFSVETLGYSEVSIDDLERKASLPADSDAAQTAEPSTNPPAAKALGIPLVSTATTPNHNFSSIYAALGGLALVVLAGCAYILIKAGRSDR